MIETAKQLKYERGRAVEGFGAFDFGIRIDVAAPTGISDGIKMACMKAADEIEQAITRDFFTNSRIDQAIASDEKRALLALFPQPIFVEPIPNGYCSRACCEHRPWFVVTTLIGRIRIGWRKRVILIDWSDTVGTKESDELFASEDVTKDKKMIHAWGYEKAQEYINRIVNDVKGA